MPSQHEGRSPSIPSDAFERVLQQAVIRPAGRSFRGEPARQVEILRYLRRESRPIPFDELHAHLRRQGVLRSERDDDASRRKAIAQAVDAINVKLGTFFFQVRGVGLLEEMFRIRIHGDDAARPSYSLQDFFEVRKLSGVRFYATTDDPAGGLTRELFELVTRIRPGRLDMMSPSLESFFGNAEFRSMLTSKLGSETGEEAARVRVLLLDPASSAARRLESQEQEESPVLGPLRDRIRSTLTHAGEIAAALPPGRRDAFSVHIADEAPLWRFRMIFLPEVLHLRLSSPGAGEHTLIKLGVSSALYTSLHDAFERQWEGARDASRTA